MIPARFHVLVLSQTTKILMSFCCCKLFNLFIYRQSILYFFKLYFQAGRRLKQPVSVIRRATLATCRETKNETVIFQFFLDSCTVYHNFSLSAIIIYGLNYVNLFTAPYKVCTTCALRISHVVINCILEFCISDILLCLIHVSRSMF